MVVLETMPLDYRKFRETIEKLSKLVLQVRLFPSNHPSCSKALSEAFMHIDSLLKEKDSIVIRISDKAFYFLNFKVSISEVHEKHINILYNLISGVSAGEIEFVKGLRKEELESFARIIAESTKRRGKEWTDSILSLEHIKLRGVREEKLKGLSDMDGAIERRSSRTRESVKKQGNNANIKIAREISEVLENLDKLHSKRGKVAAGKVIRLVKASEIEASIVFLLNSLKKYDEYTFIHSVNVAVISAALAEAAGIPEENVMLVAKAGLLHDIGKLYVPKEILNKESRLTPMEWALMKKHPVDGRRILRDEGLDIVSQRVAYEHHICYNLSGYPPVRSGYELMDVSHIIRIADTYDAITTKRPYRKQLSPYEAIKFMSRAVGKEFHPGLFNIFLRMLGNIPVGTIVRLNTGEEGIVVNIGSGDERALPVVRIIRDSGGIPVEGQVVIDLNEEANSSGGGRKIVEIVDTPIRDIDVGAYIR